MKKTMPILVFAASLLSVTAHADFLAEQQKFERVRAAVTDNQQVIEKKLQEHHLAIDDFHLLMVAYKDDDRLDIYAKKKQETMYRKIQSYEICSRSGRLGPKRKQGDGQVPEGFYHIDRFNPSSNFHLSLGINYPNLADKRSSKAKNLGGDIFIHGSCVTIGCLPVTDKYIKEIYLFAVHARNNGQSKIPVYIFPFQMTDEKFAIYMVRYKANKELVGFWSNLKVGYDQFMKDKKALHVNVNESGNYIYKSKQ